MKCNCPFFVREQDGPWPCSFLCPSPWANGVSGGLRESMRERTHTEQRYNGADKNSGVDWGSNPWRCAADLTHTICVTFIKNLYRDERNAHKEVRKHI